MSNDQNSQSTAERELAKADIPGSNEVPSRSQFLGTLSSSIASGDENARLGFVIAGSIKRNSDIDNYSFVAAGGTEVWFDIDLTNTGLDTVLELIDANGNILALSDNSEAEEQSPALLFRSPLLDANSVNPLRKTTRSLFPTDSRGTAAKDENGVNPRDAGFRVVLPANPTSPLCIMFAFAVVRWLLAMPPRNYWTRTNCSPENPKVPTSCKFVSRRRIWWLDH